jgi:hypothetical protein
MSLFAKEQKFVTTIQIIHFAQMIGAAMFGFIIFFVICSGQLEYHWSDLDMLNYLALAFCIVFPAIGISLFNKNIAQANSTELLKDKLDQYRSSFIIRTALVQGPILFCLVVTMLTKNGNMLYLIIPMFALQLYLRPTKKSISEDLMLDYKEQEEMDEMTFPINSRGY